MKKKTKEYQTFALKDIFPEYELKGYVNGIEKIVQKIVKTKNQGLARTLYGVKKICGFINIQQSNI